MTGTKYVNFNDHLIFFEACRTAVCTFKSTYIFQCALPAEESVIESGLVFILFDRAAADDHIHLFNSDRTHLYRLFLGDRPLILRFFFSTCNEAGHTGNHT